MKRWSVLLLLVGLIFSMTAYKKEGSYGHLTSDDSVRYLVSHPAFEGFSQLILPRENNSDLYDMPLSEVGSLMPYHGHVAPDIVVGALNHMIDEVEDGKTIFYEFYTEQQKQEDPAREHTGVDPVVWTA